MDENTDPKTQQNPADALREILSGGISADSKQIVIKGNKISNEFLNKLVKTLQEKEYEPEDVIKVLLTFDEQVENGNFDQEFFEGLKDPEKLKQYNQLIKENQ